MIELNNDYIDINNIYSRIEYVEESSYSTEDELRKSNKIVVHKGKSFVKSINDIGNQISETVKNALRKTSCKYGIVENIHIEAYNAEYLDGLYRICHIKDRPECRKVTLKECHDTLVAKYSALFYVLRYELDKLNIKQKDNKIDIKYDDLNKFVGVLNKMNNNLKDGEYYLRPNYSDKFVNTNVFNIVRWTSK